MAHHQTFLDTNLWESFGSPTLHKLTYMKKARGHPSLLGGNNIFRPAQKISLFPSTLIIELLLCCVLGKLLDFFCFQRSATRIKFHVNINPDSDAAVNKVKVQVCLKLSQAEIFAQAVPAPIIGESMKKP